MTFSEVASINSDRADLSDADGEFDYVDLGSVKDGRGIMPEAVKRVICREAPSRAQRLIRQGDVLVATVRPYLRGFACVPDEFDGAVASTGFAVLRASPGSMNPQFLWHLVQTRSFVAQLVARQTGGNYPAVRPADVGEATVPVPPLDEQERIASVLDPATEATFAAQAHLAALAQLRTSLRVETFATLDAPSRELRTVGTFARGGSFPTAEQGRTEGDFPVFKVADMNTPGNERALIVPANWVSEEQFSRLRMKLWPLGTVVFPRVGAALAGDRRRLLAAESVLDDNMLGVTPDSALLRPYFFMLALEEVGMAAMAQHGAVPSINAKLAGAVEIPVPSLEDQDTLTERFQALDEATDVSRRHLDVLAVLSLSLREALTSGVVRCVQPDHFEPVAA